MLSSRSFLSWILLSPSIPSSSITPLPVTILASKVSTMEAFYTFGICTIAFHRRWYASIDEHGSNLAHVLYSLDFFELPKTATREHPKLFKGRPPIDAVVRDLTPKGN